MPAHRKRFAELCSRVASVPEAEIESAWSLIAKGYGESHRHYHNLDHLAALLVDFDEVDEENSAIEFAIWFHDIVYDPGSGTNEADSATLFQQWSSDLLNPDFRSEVSRLILATDPRLARTDLSDEMLLCDLDLLVLSADPETYQQYARNIRREYHFVPEGEFRKGRAGILKNFLKGRIYWTEIFSPREDMARQNIETELGRLVDSG